MDAATTHMIGLLRTLADELEAGKGTAVEAKIDCPRGYGFTGETTTTRTYSLQVVLLEPREKGITP